MVNAYGTEELFEYSVQNSDDGPIGILTGDIPNYPAARQIEVQDCRGIATCQLANTVVCDTGGEHDDLAECAG